MVYWSVIWRATQMLLPSNGIKLQSKIFLSQPFLKDVLLFNIGGSVRLREQSNPP